MGQPVDDNRTNDSSITTEVDAHFFRFGNIQMQKIVTPPTRETYH